MTGIVRENPTSGRVLGIAVSNANRTLYIRARKGVIIGTGGHTSNVNFRRIFDPRLTEEYQVAGEPYSYQDASGEIAAMAVGASLWGASNQTGEFGQTITKAGYIGCQYGYANLTWEPKSQYFSKAGASGLRVARLPERDPGESDGPALLRRDAGPVHRQQLQFHQAVHAGQLPQRRQHQLEPAQFPQRGAWPAIGDGSNGGGPIWAIFDADAVQREKWTVRRPAWTSPGVTSSPATRSRSWPPTSRTSTRASRCPPPRCRKPSRATTRFVDGGKDLDFGKAAPKYKIETPPFYAAWATPVLHDTRSGLRINAKCEVVDLDGKVIPGLYCGGESAGGFSLHGLARCCVQGRIAGREAARATLASSASARG